MPNTPLYDDWVVPFIEALRRTAVVKTACDAAGVPRATAFRERDRNPAFRARWDDAVSEAVEELEAEARARALGGSDQLLIFLLKAYRPQIYGTRVEVNLALVNRLAAEFGIDPAELEAETRALLEGRTSLVDELYAHTASRPALPAPAPSPASTEPVPGRFE